jgi:hypothetical protein
LPSRRSRLRSRLMRPQEPRNRKIDEHGTDRYLLGRSAAFTRERRLPRAPRLRATPFSSTSTSSPLGQPPRHANRRLLTWSASPVRLSCAAGRDRPSHVKAAGTRSRRSGTSNRQTSCRSAVGELPILLEPGNALRRQRPHAVGQPHRKAVVRERPKVERRAHITAPPPDRLLDIGHGDSEIRLPARSAPQRFKDMDPVTSTHGPIVADRSSDGERWPSGDRVAARSCG